MPTITEISETSRAGQPSAWGDEAGKPVALNISESSFQDPRVQNILAALHAGLYQDTFPLDDERESLETWSKKLLETDGENKAPKQFFTAHFTDVEAASDLADQMKPFLDKIAANPDAEKSDIFTAQELENYNKLQDDFTNLTVSFVVGEYYDTTNAALINYVVRNKKFDGKNGKPKFDAKDMVDHQVRQYQEYATSLGEELHVVGWELNNPETVKFFNDDGTPNFDIDVMDPYRRQGIVEGFEGRDINFKWIQSPLDTTLKMCADLRLYSYPIPGGVTVSDKERGEALGRYVDAFYQSFPEDIAGRFNTAQEYATDCKERSAQIGRLPDSGEFIINSNSTFLEKFGETINDKILTEARTLCANVGAVDPEAKKIPDDLILQLNQLITNSATTANAEEIKEILNHTLGLLKKEFDETALAVEGMIAGIEQIKLGTKTFQSDVELKDNAKIAEGQRKLKVYDLAVEIKEAMEGVNPDPSKLQELMDKLNDLGSDPKYRGKTYNYEYTDKAGIDVDVTVDIKKDVERVVKIIDVDGKDIWNQFAKLTKPKEVTQFNTDPSKVVSGPVPRVADVTGYPQIRDQNQTHIINEGFADRQGDESQTTKAPKKSEGLLTKLFHTVTFGMFRDSSSSQQAGGGYVSQSKPYNPHSDNTATSRSANGPNPSVKATFTQRLMDGLVLIKDGIKQAIFGGRGSGRS